MANNFITLNFARNIFFIVFLFSSLNAISQVYPFNNWDKQILVKANTAREVGYLTDEEKKVIFYINLVRMDPLLFSKTYLQKFLDSSETKNNKWVISLKNSLEKAIPVKPLFPEEDLFEVAKKHAVEMGKSGRVGHDGYKTRTNQIENKYDRIAEDCDYGNSDGLSIVILLLIDEGVVDAGHRKAILEENHFYIGTSIQPHAVYLYNCVIEFAGKFIK